MSCDSFDQLDALTALEQTGRRIALALELLAASVAFDHSRGELRHCDNCDCALAMVGQTCPICGAP